MVQNASKYSITTSKREHIEWKKIEWKMQEASQVATKEDYQDLVKYVGSFISLSYDKNLKNKTTNFMNDWAETIFLSDYMRGKTMQGNAGMEWLLATIIQDNRTIKVFQTSDDKQIFVQANKADIDTQHEYTDYLIKAFEKFGYFSCDVLIVKESEISCLNEFDNSFRVVYSKSK